MSRDEMVDELIAVPEKVLENEKETLAPNVIITPNDTERWSLLEVPSQACSLPITDVDAAMIGKMDSILDILDDTAAGLAAVQVGYPKRIFLLRENGINRAFINPVIISRSKEFKRDGEACLSLPGFSARIKRPKRLTLQYYDLDGELKIEEFKGFWAKAVSHELSHLAGKLITHELEAEMGSQTKRNKFGMKMDAAARKRIEKRRAKKKRA